jgi:ATP-dependent DNA helicase RecQ
VTLELLNYLQRMQKDLLILTAPPASGKTHLIENLIQQFRETPLVISPLRALANECFIKWGPTCAVATPEEWLNKKRKSNIIIFDEFHLYFYWGDSFRPSMWEAFFEATQSAELVVLLTATLTAEMLKEIKLFGCQFDQMIWVNHGNQQLKYMPKRYTRAYDLKWMERLIESDLSSFGTSLIFCPYRADVEKWEKRLISRGKTVWSCVGGEAHLFSQKCQTETPPQFIVATTVLSHGVNLPTISQIFFLYPVRNLDFWIQMVARGGRRGESFVVYALENPIGIKWSQSLNFLAILRLSLRMKWQHSLKQIQEWFLKA